MRKIQTLILFLLTAKLSLAALPLSFQAQSSQRISGNSIVEIIFDGTALWVGTNNGISRTTDGGLTWEIFNKSNGLTFEEISALAFKPGSILAAGAHTEIISGFEVPVGEGFNISTDTGQTWFGSLPFQAASPGMLAYDLTAADTIFYAACFLGGLIRSFDNGSTWENVYVDTLAQIDFEDSLFEDYRNRYFAVAADSLNPDTLFLWAGTAAGIEQFIYTDSLKFDQVVYYQQIDTFTCIRQKSYLCTPADSILGYHLEIDTFFCGNRVIIREDTIYCPTADTVIDRDSVVVYPQISGNFVVALGVQKWPNGRAIWAAARPTFSGTMAVNFTRDEGNTWDTALTDELVWDFAFQDTIVWVATSSGLKRSSDWGQTWQNFVGMEDFSDTCENKIFSPEFFALETVGETLWAGGADGLVRTTDGGSTWRVYRAYQPIGTPGSTSAYAYPSPFSPRIGAGVTRIHHKPLQTGSVTVEIFDFAMNKVVTLVNNEQKIGGQECDEPWDGRDKDGNEVATGVYFFKVQSPGQTQWGKVVVLK